MRGKGKKSQNAVPLLVELYLNDDVFGYADIARLPQRVGKTQVPAAHPYPLQKEGADTPTPRSLFNKKPPKPKKPSKPEAYITTIDPFEKAIDGYEDPNLKAGLTFRNGEPMPYSPYFDTLVPSLNKASICVLLIKTNSADIAESAAFAQARNKEIAQREIFTAAVIMDPDHLFTDRDPLPDMTKAIFHNVPTIEQYIKFIQTVVEQFRTNDKSPKTLRYSPTLTTKHSSQDGRLSGFYSSKRDSVKYLVASQDTASAESSSGESKTSPKSPPPVNPVKEKSESPDKDSQAALKADSQNNTARNSQTNPAGLGTKSIEVPELCVTPRESSTHDRTTEEKSEHSNEYMQNPLALVYGKSAVRNSKNNSIDVSTEGSSEESETPTESPSPDTAEEKNFASPKRKIHEQRQPITPNNGHNGYPEELAPNTTSPYFCGTSPQNSQNSPQATKDTGAQKSFQELAATRRASGFTFGL